MKNDRKRNRQTRKSKKIVLIAYEGSNKTEKIYFENFNEREKNYIVRSVPGNETDPINLVKQTKKEIKRLDLDLDYDRAYCVFDADVDQLKDAQIKEALKLAEKNKIIPILSVPCIEIWFYLHFKYSTAYVNNENIIDKLKEYIPNYEKNLNVFPMLKENTKVAIINAKKLEKFHIKNGNELHSVNTNPYTEIYKLVEDLLNDDI